MYSMSMNMPILINTPVNGNSSNLNSSKYANLISSDLLRENQFRLLAEKVWPSRYRAKNVQSFNKFHTTSMVILDY